MDRIEIDARTIAAGEQKLESMRTGGAYNAILTDVDDRALEGKVIEYNTPFAKGDKYYLFKPGCFDANRHKRTGYQVAHLPLSEVASTDDALDIIYGPGDVRFRLDLDRAKNGSVIGRLCESGSYTAMSIGATFEDAREETIAGHKVTVVYKARLNEISQCKEGAAGDQAFAYLVDKTVVPKPTAGRKSATMDANQAMHKINRKVRGLKERLSAIADYEPGTVVEIITLDQSNSLQRDETERLQALARLHHDIE